MLYGNPCDWSLFSVSVPSPVPGAQFSVGLGPNFQYLLRVVRFRFTTSAAVANRTVGLDIVWPSLFAVTCASPTVQTAVLSLHYQAADFGAGVASTATDGFIVLPPLFLEEDTIVRSNILLLQAADQLDEIFVSGLRRRLT